MSNPFHSVTEFAFLNLIPPTTLQNRKLIEGFLNAAEAQSSWSGYPLHFFFSSNNPRPHEEASPSGDRNTGEVPVSTMIYIVSGWASAQAHNEWIASPKNQEILKFFGDAGMMSVGGVVHLDINFAGLSFEECDAVVWRKIGSGGGGVSQAVQEVGSGDDGSAQDARLLWSHRGRAVDDGVEDEYELCAYSEGGLRDSGEGYTVMCKWKLE
ncbi:hypothetical protein P691DRAFT_802172 [Macrolepiota fuliginosa MF-IS2]|uniref:Uncharacterized protein n=1 Tax=Macrolepiota fuliginosa MF-IS2 TaxID=1400762 RepID=A0A9P5XDK4_9AGAR|nr:hypothetical protein P691DRAFT_802172 [Macrolepiota fuliginosa MF-IS2]